MKHYWQNLNDRERWMVLAAAVVLVLYAYYLLLYVPLATQVALKTKLVQEKYSTLAWMKRISTQKDALQKKKIFLENNQIASVISKNLKNSTLNHFTYNLQQTSSGDTDLNFKEAPFNQSLSWLHDLSEHYQINIRQIDMSATLTPGLVSLRLILNNNPKSIS